MSQVLLESRWDETREALLEGLKGNRRSTMGVILENTRKSLLAESASGTTMSGNIATLNRVILPVIRRVMPTVIANELVGVQPMTGPVGQIHTLRVRYANSLTDNSGAGTSVTAGEEALSPFKIAQAYSTTAAGAGSSSTYTGAATATLEGNGGNQISVQILRQAVEAKSRKLQARWTFEAAQDAQSQHGIDVEAEIMAALAQEITAEIDQEILLSLSTLATTEATYNQATVSGTATFVGVMIVVIGLGNLDGSRLDVRKWQVAPAPEFRGGRAGDAGNGGGVARALDGELFALRLGERRGALAAILLATQQRTTAGGGGFLRRLEFFGEPPGQLLDISAPERGDRNFFPRGVNGHRFQRRFLRQRIGHRARETFFRNTFVSY